MYGILILAKNLSKLYHSLENLTTHIAEDSDECCDEYCKLKEHAKCSDKNSPCCSRCNYSKPGDVCRHANYATCEKVQLKIIPNYLLAIRIANFKYVRFHSRNTPTKSMPLNFLIKFENVRDTDLVWFLRMVTNGNTAYLTLVEINSNFKMLVSDWSVIQIHCNL